MDGCSVMGHQNPNKKLKYIVRFHNNLVKNGNMYQK